MYPHMYPQNKLIRIQILHTLTRTHKYAQKMIKARTHVQVAHMLVLRIKKGLAFTISEVSTGYLPTIYRLSTDYLLAI